MIKEFKIIESEECLMKSIRITVVATFFILGSLVLSACSSDSSSDNDKNTLTYAYWSDIDMDAVHKEAKKIFEKKYPDTELKRQIIPRSNYYTKMKTSVGGGSGADVFLMNGVNFALFQDLDLLKNIQPMINESEVDMSVYPKGIVELYSNDGDVYGIPYYEGALALYYNKEIFDNAGVPYPDETWTWEDVKEKGEKLANQDKKIYGIALSQSLQETLYPLVKQAGGNVLTEDGTGSGFGTPETKEAVKYIQDLIKKGVSPSAQVVLETETKQLFASGRAAMVPSGSYNLNLFKETLGDNVGVAVLPHNEKRGYLIHGSSYVMNESTENEKKAFELMKILTGLKVQKTLAESGGNFPAHMEAVDTWLDTYESMDLSAFKKGLENTGPYPVSLKTSEWQTVIEEQLTKALMLKISADEASNNIKNGMDKVLKSEE